MSIESWINRNTASLKGRTVAVTGSTGGLGQALCRLLARLEADLILLDRNPKKAEDADARLLEEFPSLRIRRIPLDLEDIASVKAAALALQQLPVDFLVLNAGAYSIPRKTCATGLDNVFQINFASPYYLVRELLPLLRRRHGRVIAVGSIAHRYSKSDPNNVDFASVKQASKVYGNAKRYLMGSLYSLFENEQDASLAIVHPGITFTNITSHYPKLIFALIKHPMKVIFMKTDKAALSTLQGFFDSCDSLEWIGPRRFDVWGYPVKKRLKDLPTAECHRMAQDAESIHLATQQLQA